jgi:hypothetical protein
MKGKKEIKPKNKTPGKRGRKDRYETHVKPRLQEIAWWLRDGAIEEEVCKRLGVSVAAFSEYKHKFPELVETIKVSKQQADYEVEDALYKRARGIEYEEVTYENIYNPITGDPILDAEGEIKQTITKRVRKFIPPDTGAAMAWLKNRQPDKWKDKQNIELEGNLEYKINIPDELK